MKIINTIEEINEIINHLKKQNKIIGFVPTMGALHKGHASLLNEAKKLSDIVVASVFVNPTQFGPNEDYNKYPRSLENDIVVAEENNVDYMFVPSTLEIYPTNTLTTIHINKLTNIFEGKLRPGHFEGVGLILIKLFNIIKPNYAFFGQKDYQQTLVVKQIVKDLNVDTKIIVCPTIRLTSGLAISSRNTYLSEDELQQAGILFKAMESAKDIIEKGERNRSNINAAMRNVLLTNKNIKIDYASIVMAEDLTEPNIFQPGDITVLLLAVYLGNTRLIDNSLITFY
ncbi:MAG: pantoate--beta-alanine ligase [Bacteroidetes bacterium]|nr:pantoate--beta-alanine ligase [Bacteroidota bacterium]